MTKEEASEELSRLHKIVKNWRAKDAWHDAVRDRNDNLFDYKFTESSFAAVPFSLPCPSERSIP